MKLVSFKITDYKCIIDSGKVDLTDIGCLVGKNESGKTAILQSLYRINPIDEADKDFNVTNEYPRTSVSEYEHAVSNETKEPATVVSAIFSIEDSDFAEHDIDSQLLPDKKVEVSRGYYDGTHFKLNVDESKYINWRFSEIEFVEDDNNRDLANSISKCKTIQEIESLNVESHTVIPQCAPLLEFLTQMKGINAELDIYTKFIEPILPRFLYFDEFYQMSGIVNIPKLKARVAENRIKNSDKPMLGLIKLARLSLESFDEIKNTRQLLNKLEGASNRIQKSFMKYWSQSSNISLQLDVRDGKPQDDEEFRAGANILTFIRDNIHQVTTMIGERSRGFIWFFSFIAWFSLQKTTHDCNIILLLDEPGLTLHAKAQYDLLRYIEQELSPHHQVIYTTHSPFMIDMKHLDRVSIVEDKGLDDNDEIIGTKLTDNILETGRDSLFPLQSALGYDITQSLFVGPYCLIVEGPSDLLYLTAVSSILEKSGKTYLDSRWTITPVGGIDKVPAFVSLFGSQKALKLAVLIDFQSKDEQMIESLYIKKLIKRSNIITFSDFVDAKDADIEDLFDPEFYIKVVNKEYEKDLDSPINIKQLNSKIPRITIQLDKYFKDKPLKQGIQYNHYRPARHFNEHIHELQAEIGDKTLKVFEEIFEKLNSLIK
ncbi:MAG: AAA family ATPase [Candidatus Cloacimonetes bacterium]|nr:AAA family ATPase [Candidatus Cloacimonadota bacterium]